MEDKLTVRVYNVGFGDAILLQVPDKYRDKEDKVRDEQRNILVDLGTNSKWELLRKTLQDDIAPRLPLNAQGNKRVLDLVVVTHAHKDHFNGFDHTWFKDIQVNRIWLSVFMKPNHPQAKKGLALQALADRAARSMLLRSGAHLGAGMRDLLMNSVYNDDAMRALREQIPQASGISPLYPLYVCRDIAYRLTAKKRREYGLRYDQRTTCFRFSGESDTRIRVLAPEWDIDGHYLSDKALNASSLCSAHAGGEGGEGRGYGAFMDCLEDSDSQPRMVPEQGKQLSPQNISVSDFRRLRERLLHSALAFAQDDDDLKNNTSVVLLLEWRNRRLLFAADAEWGGGYHEGHANHAWDVILKKDGENKPENRHLSTPVHFLKVGHHGSINGTPWDSEAADDGQQALLDQLLGAPSDSPEAGVVVSTRAGSYGKQKKVPYPELMRQLGLRSTLTSVYEPDEEGQEPVSQPLRTDKEFPQAVENVQPRHIPIEIDPDPQWQP